MKGHPDLVGLMDLLLADSSRLDGALADMGISENGDEVIGGEICGLRCSTMHPPDIRASVYGRTASLRRGGRGQ